jgi:hypothetical protein
MPGKTPAADTIVIRPVTTQTITVGLVGTSPIVLNRLSEKARHELLLPRGKKDAARKASELKHDPIDEFRSSPYLLADEKAPSFLAIMSSAIKGAMMTAALDLPGAKKAQIGRLVYVENDYTPIFGLPKLFMSITRSADMNRTPDVRTRAIVPYWAALVSVRFVVPILDQSSIINLLAAGGVTAGIGDWRPEKGKGSYGQFTVVNADDPEFLRIAKDARAEQIAAMNNPEPYDSETESLLEWFKDEAETRGKKAS